jgi:ABC-type antimicrobial peptide transport system permease subunit
MTEVAFLEAVSGSYFSVLGVETILGRSLTVDDDRPGADPVAVLSHRWWQRSFGGEPSVLGRTIYLNFRPFTVVGVASPQFLGTAASFRPDVWIPFAPFRDRYTGWAAMAEDRDTPLVRVYGRLRTGVGEARARAGLASVAGGLDEAYPRKTRPRRIHLGRATWIDPSARLSETPTVRLMMVAAAVFLLLACANVANLLLSLSAGRQREISVRAALGASPGRLFRQVLTENVLLSGVAGGVALLLAGPASARLGSYFARPSVWGANV